MWPQLYQLDGLVAVADQGIWGLRAEAPYYFDVLLYLASEAARFLNPLGSAARGLCVAVSVCVRVCVCARVLCVLLCAVVLCVLPGAAA